MGASEELARLKRALQKMPATGAKGFEGLIAALLSALTGDHYYVARSGDQPADAVSGTGRVAVQTKRFRDSTSIDETAFEGDYSKACRSSPHLDCYVFAATRVTAQLRQLADTMQEIMGVDIVLLGFSEDEPEIAALCATYWSQLSAFPELRIIHGVGEQWAGEYAKKPTTITLVDSLRDQLSRSTLLAPLVGRKLRTFLDERFGLVALSRPTFGYPIRLSESIMRSGPMQRLDAWWTDGKSAAAVVRGEEGMGKSWVAAQFAHRLASDGASLVIWLDSANWFGADNIESAIKAGLAVAGIQDARLLERLARKAISRWSDRLLIVFDGINEHGARQAACQLMQQLGNDPRPCRAVFSTRPIQWASDESGLWNPASIIDVGRFAEMEFQAALARSNPPIPREEIPAGLADLARIPRYFHRCVRLRERFQSLLNVTKEMVLWEDLLQKIAEGDRQVVKNLGWTSPADLKRALGELARAARLVAGEGITESDGYAILTKAFSGRYQEVRSDLAEQRVVVDPNGDNPQVSPEHVILGYALHIGAVAAKLGSRPVAEIADRITRELEPMGSQDQIVEALFVALQLSVMPPTNAHELSSSARAALMLLWTSSQNSVIHADRLSFWAEADLPAYLDFVEEVYLEPVTDGWAQRICDPICQRFATATADTSPLKERLRRWLTLIWKSHDLPPVDETIHEGHALPIARNQCQLSLGRVAVAVISQKPDVDLVDDLAIAWATASLSTYRHFHSSTPSGPPDRHQDIPCKDLRSSIGALMRWRYTEAIKPALIAKVASMANDSLMKRGFDGLIESFDRFGWRREGVHEKELREGRPLFSKGPEASRNRFVDCAELAVRDDLPELDENDQAVIADKVERAFADPRLRASSWQSSADQDLEWYLAWYARYREASLVQLSTTFRFEALTHPDFSYAQDYCQLLPFAKSRENSRRLLELLISAGSRDLGASKNRESWALTGLHVQALTCLEEAELQQWLEFACGLPRLRQAFHFYPIMMLVPYAVSPAIAGEARTRVRQIHESGTVTDDGAAGCSSSEIDYWATIGGLAGEPDSAFHSWIDQKHREGDRNGFRPFYGALLWFRTATDQQQTDAVASGRVFELLDEHGWRAMLFVGCSAINWSAFRMDYEMARRKMGIDDLGIALHEARRDRDFERWGHDLFGLAMQAVGTPPFERTYWGTTIHCTNAAGRIDASTCEDADAEDMGQLRPPPGVDIWKKVGTWSNTEEQEREANRGIQLWKREQRKLNAAGVQALDRFGAQRELETWRDRFPEGFRANAERLLREASSDLKRAFHIGGFLAAVLDALVPLEPQLALELDREVARKTLRVNVVNHYGRPTFIAAFWQAAGQGNLECQRTCTEMLEAAATDDELRSHALMAQAEEAAAFLRAHCLGLLSNEFAKTRCLAVSLMAWIGESQNLDKLEALSKHDPSGWVRTHAEWALGVARQESAAIRHYEKTLTLDDRNRVLARMQVLKPALTRLSYWWHGKLEASVGTKNIPASVASALDHFWYDVRSRRRNPPPPANGRKLDEYLRGDRIKDLQSPRPKLVDLPAAFVAA
jgi:hypothetical protein